MTGKKKPRFSEEDWELIQAYGHGYGYGVSDLELEHLWSPEEEGYHYEIQGWKDGVDFLGSHGELEGDLIDWDNIEDPYRGEKRNES
jgi:hypothetical protein